MPETLQAHLVRQIVDALRVSQNVSLSYLDNAKSRIAKVVTQLDSVNAAKDQDLFIQHNRRTFLPVPDWTFEASPIHYDTVRYLHYVEGGFWTLTPRLALGPI